MSGHKGEAPISDIRDAMRETPQSSLPALLHEVQQEVCDPEEDPQPNMLSS